MRRKNDAHDKEELEGVAQRLRNERPEASPLQLDQIKTSAMSRAKAGTRRRSAGTRRLATAGLAIGLLAAGTGGVIAGGSGDPHGGSSSISASSTQYGGECNITNGSGNVGDGNGASANNNACNENIFTITNNNTTITNENNTTSPVTVVPVTAPAASSGVLASKTTKPALSLRDIKIHLNVSRKTHLKKVTLKLDGKTFKVLKGKAASKNISLTSLPCSNGATTITVVAVTSSGKTVTESHTFHLCQA
jgi:hypothetical protein